MWPWLLKVEPMGRSLSSYGPIVLLEKAVTYGRLIVMTWLLGTLQYGIWQLGVMVFNVTGAVAALGSSHGVGRYVSYYQARGQLRQFYRQACAGVAVVAAAMTAVGLACSPWMADLLAGTDAAGAGLARSQRLVVVVLALVNGLLMALYQNLQYFIRALRTFRLLAVMDLVYASAFTALGLVLAGWTGSGLAVLAGHALSLLLGIVLGMLAAGRCLKIPQVASVPAEKPLAAPAPKATSILGRLLKFGFVSMLGALLWEVGNQVSAWFTNRYRGPEQVGIYTAFRQLCQPVWVLSGMLWGLVFSHVASHWESGRRDDALRMTGLTYKAVVLALMTLTVIALATARWWTLVLSASFRADLSLLAGLLMFYQCSTNLGLASTASRLQERPIIFVLITAAGVIANVVLARWLVPGGGLSGAAWAAGISALVATALGVGYLVLSGLRVHPACHVLALSPALLLLPAGAGLLVWAGVLVVAAFTPLVFASWEKAALRDYLRSLGGYRR